MILPPDFGKPHFNNELHQESSHSCAHGCAIFQLEYDLASFIALWPTLKGERRQALLTLMQPGDTTNSPKPLVHDTLAGHSENSGSFLPSTFDSSHHPLKQTTPLPQNQLFSESEWNSFLVHFSLPERQVEILRFLICGENDKQIARKLGISLPTLRTHLQRMYVRFNVSNRTSLVVEVFRLARSPSN